MLKVLSPFHSVQKILTNSEGMAAFEMIPIIVIFVLLMSFTFGFFGSIHTGILTSIAARNYAFETFRHRSNLVYFKDSDPNPTQAKTNYSKPSTRHHGIGSEHGSNSEYTVANRPIDKFGVVTFEGGDDPTLHNRDVRGLSESRRNTRVAVNRIWVKTIYGICINNKCSE